MMAPVDGSGSWPAWMQTVGKRADSGSFTPLTLSAARWQLEAGAGTILFRAHEHPPNPGHRAARPAPDVSASRCGVALFRPAAVASHMGRPAVHCLDRVQ